MGLGGMALLGKAEVLQHMYGWRKQKLFLGTELTFRVSLGILKLRTPC